MKINIEWNGCKCFGACGKWFDPISLYAEFQGIKPHQALVDLEKLFNVKWDGSCEELLETADQLSPWSRLEAELIRQCEVASLEEPQRIRMRSSYEPDPKPQTTSFSSLWSGGYSSQFRDATVEFLGPGHGCVLQ
jgi:hypothetical protein